MTKFYQCKNFRSWSDDQFINAVKSSYSIAQVIRKLNLSISGATYRIVHKHIDRLNLDTSHFTGKGHCKGKYGTNGNKTILEILSNNSNYQSSSIRRILLNEGFKQNVCEECGISTWNGSSITCQVHHKNGDKYDNRLDNLVFLCPNCHSITDNWGSKNKI